ncbi:transcriptional regulator [Frankia sp. AgB1.9]|uniref:transcriptional regulator n=1 Tax=unclassified Frankia TaxID=2632575 RepID=UPI00193212F3|nr:MULTISPECIES: transcriptional regulator [unclassified Frankia]MBL7492904.1 transcriptional regulator [Frankia sp. AgW1.1]MBL7553556.1 transcriptional regulator [Frankia sp. AgB1.9]MBL7618514.1 transcriptional regulator [Frankia sp. AgB1.8]
MRVSRNLRRSLAVTLAGVTVVGAAALPASAATSAPARPASAVHGAPAQREVRVDIAVEPVPAAVTAVLVRNATTGAVVGVFPVRSRAVTHLTVTVPVGTTLDISALTAANANRPANLGTVRVVVGPNGSTAAGNAVTVTFRQGSKPKAALGAQLARQGAKLSVR